MKLPAYSKYKPSGVEWLGDVPNDWEIKKLRYLGLLRSGENITSEQLEDEGMFPVYGGNGLRGYSTRFTHEGDHVLIGRQGALCGNINYAKGKFWASEHAVVVQPRVKFATFWMGELLRAMNLNQYSVSAAQPGLAVDTVSALKIPVPSSSEQCAIADFLERETARLDTLVGKKRALIEKLKEKRTALISRTVTRGLPAEAAAKAGLNPRPKLNTSGLDWLGDIPEHWEVKRLSWLFRYAKGPNAATLTKEYVGSNVGDFPVFSGQTENEGLMGMIDTYEFDFATSAIFVTTVGARAMTTRLVSGKFSLSQNCALIIPRNTSLSVAYYNGVLRRLFDFERRSISLIMQPSLRFEDLNKFRVPRPPPPEQRLIADYLDDETAKIDKMMKKVEAAIEKLHEYRIALITAAVTGKIDVRKAADSPGSTPAQAASTLPA